MSITVPFLLCLLLCVSLPSFVSSLTYCQRGTYEFQPRIGKEVCELCEPGTFMPYHNHRYKQCFPCTQIENPDLEIQISPCNRTRDSIIHCKEGYYRRRPMNPREKERCEKCTDCGALHTTLPCRTYDDTHCCWGENFEVVLNRDGIPVCQEKPWLCRQGQYFDLSYFQCLPCQNDTFMSQDYHSMTKCFDCHTDTLPKHIVVTQSCNSTHGDVLGCEDGFYISHTMGNSKRDLGCSQCKNCSETGEKFEGRKCSPVQNTVCCPQPNMRVIDTERGPECWPPSTTVTKNLTMTLQTNTRSRSLTHSVPAELDEGENITITCSLDGPQDLQFVWLEVEGTWNPITNDTYFREYHHNVTTRLLPHDMNGGACSQYCHITEMRLSLTEINRNTTYTCAIREKGDEIASKDIIIAIRSKPRTSTDVTLDVKKNSMDRNTSLGKVSIAVAAVSVIGVVILVTIVCLLHKERRRLLRQVHGMPERNSVQVFHDLITVDEDEVPDNRQDVVLNQSNLSNTTFGETTESADESVGFDSSDAVL